MLVLPKPLNMVQDQGELMETEAMIEVIRLNGRYSNSGKGVGRMSLAGKILFNGVVNERGSNRLEPSSGAHNQIVRVQPR